MLKVIPKKKWRYPLALEREYSKYLVCYVEQNMAVIKQFLPQMEELLLSYSEHIAGAAVQLEILLDRIHAARKDPEQMTATVNAMSVRVNRYNQQEWDAVIKSVLGMPMSGIPFDRIHHDAEADNALRELWVSENLDLIRSIDEQTMQRVKSMLQERIVGTVNRRELSKDLTDEIQRIAGLERNRAMLIGRDQVGKLNGRLMQYRQQHAGIEEYRWSSSHDQRVRPSHRQYDGKVYTWGSENPAPEGSPGIPVRCRCVAIPVIDLDKIVTRPVSQSYTILQPMNYMSNTFKPQLSNVVNQVKIGSSEDGVTIETRMVKNSQFVMYAETELQRRDTAVRVAEKLLREIRKKLPSGYVFPPVVIINIEKQFGIDAIGGYDKATGRLAISSHYDTEDKILGYVTANKDFFANKTQYAPMLHELGHKLYYDTIKKLLKKRRISYNVSKGIVDAIIKEWAESRIIKGYTLDRALSAYADKGYTKRQYTEVVAEAFSVNDTNEDAKKLVEKLKGLTEDDATTD